MSHTLKLEGLATLLSSLSHGGDHDGTTMMLRRERIVQPDGSVEEVPVVSGNSLRGVLRDYAADRLWRMLGEPVMSLPTFDALWGGGALAKAGAGNVLTSRQLTTLRDRVPMVSLFGCSGGGRIIEGRLQVGKLVPVCAETAHLLPPEVLDGYCPEPVVGLLQIEQFTRRDDAKRSSLGAAIDTEDTLVAREVAQQMRYGVETIAAGTKLYWWLAIRECSDLEVACLRDAIEAWGADGAHLGGRSSTGHGRLKLDVDQWISTRPEITAGTPLPAMRAALEVHVEHHRDEILEALSWLV